MTFFHGKALASALIEAGLAPAKARNIELQFPMDGPAMLRYELFIEDTDIPKLQQALGALLAKVER